MADKAEIDSAALKRPSFAPKPRIRPKPKGGAATSKKTTAANLKIEPIDPPPILNTSTELCTYSPENLKLDLEAPSTTVVSAVVATAMDVDEAVPEEAAPPEVEEDVVVREIDVFFTPSSEEDETKLYVMQFPLRPRWRPYDLAEKCTEVRVMPKRAKMELDLSLDTGRNNFDRDFAESMGIDKQTLSSEVAPCATDYAVGVLKDNQIYLNPIYSVVQMRPVVKSEDQKRKRESLKDSSLPSSSKTMKKDPADSNQIEEEEEWVPLEFHPENSDLSFEHGKSLALDSLNIVDFKMSKSDYMGSLCPMNNFNKKEAFRKSIKHLPLDEQIKQWVTKKTVNTFEEIRVIFAPSTPSSEILSILQSYTFLIQGQWVTKSALLYNPSDPTLQFESHARDFILLQLSKNKPIPFSTIEKHFGTRALEGDFKLKRMFDQLTVKREECRDLKFRFSPDLKFGKRFPGIVREQEEEWIKREKGVLDNLSKFGPRGVSKLVSNVTNASISGSGNNNDNNNNNDSRNNMNKNKGVNGKSIAEPETRKNLLEALTIIFEEQKVRTVGSVVRDLREMAKRLSALPKETSKNRQIIEASLRGVNANVADLNEAITQVAIHVGNNVFVRKTRNRDNLRNVFIRFCIDKKEFKKKEIMDLARTYFKREVKEIEFTKVVEDICDVTEDGGLVLKSGD